MRLPWRRTSLPSAAKHLVVLVLEQGECVALHKREFAPAPEAMFQAWAGWA